MPYFSSNHGQILLSLRDLIKDQQLNNLQDDEVQVRYSWLQNGQPLRGITIYELPETSNNGVIGAQDIGYTCGIVFVDGATYDGIMDNDNIKQWVETVRRRLTDQRLDVTIQGATDPKEHVMIVNRSGENLSNPGKYPNYKVRRTVVTVWLRETA
jgi:hypothetical protein